MCFKMNEWGWTTFKGLCLEAGEISGFQDLNGKRMEGDEGRKILNSFMIVSKEMEKGVYDWSRN